MLKQPVLFSKRLALRPGTKKQKQEGLDDSSSDDDDDDLGDYDSDRTF